MTDLLELQSILAQLTKTNDKLIEKRNSVETMIEKLVNQIDDVSDRIAKIKIDSGEWSWSEILDATTQGSLWHRHCRDEIYKLGFWMDGYFPETNQYKLSLMMNYDDPKTYDQTLKGIRHFTKYMRPLASNYFDDGEFRFGIQEYTLSKNGFPQFHLSTDLTKAVVSFTRYHGIRIVFEGSMEDALSYVAKKYYNRREEVS